MRYTVTRQRINVIGTIWQGITCAMDYNLTSYDMENLGDPKSREAIHAWLDTNAGDFAHISDFRANFHIGKQQILHDWQTEESEGIYNDCMFQDA